MLNYNLLSTFDLDLIPDEINSRAKLDTGTFCNYACTFCYYLDKLDETTDLETIKARAKTIREFGIKEIDLSGGESSLHKNWFEILDYCKELGFERISCLTNGFKFADKDFMAKSKNHGLSELLISLHGWDAESHSQIVKRKGAFEKILKAIENSKILGLRVRINCTVTSFNAPQLVEHAKLLNSILPDQVNYLPLNFWEAAGKLQPDSYDHLSSAIKSAIDVLDQRIHINVRYIPFCFMEGYEEYVVDTYQHIFDHDDWNIIAYDVHSINPEYKNNVESYFVRARDIRAKHYTKKAECFDCKYFGICDGVENRAINQKLYPKKGVPIRDVLHFSRNRVLERQKSRREIKTDETTPSV